MIPTEVLRAIQKMPLADRRRILEELALPTIQADSTDASVKEKRFVNGLKQKGLLTETPLALPDDEFRRCFKRIECKGKTVSETIIRERG